MHICSKWSRLHRNFLAPFVKRVTARGIFLFMVPPLSNSLEFKSKTEFFSSIIILIHFKEAFHRFSSIAHFHVNVREKLIDCSYLMQLSNCDFYHRGVDIRWQRSEFIKTVPLNFKYFLRRWNNRIIFL